MAKRHSGLPRPLPIATSKSWLLEVLRWIDTSREATQRVLALENEFRRRITSHVGSLPAEDAKFEKFNTSPFVLMIHCLKRHYSRISEIEQDIMPAKEFSSMETSAGRMIEAVALPAYGWTIVPSAMHSPNSALDGKCLDGPTLKLATLKSGLRCLNDEMSADFANNIIDNFHAWARDDRVSSIDFTYGVLYGTPRQSNKKDWHILRNLDEKLPAHMTVRPDGQWTCAFEKDGITVTATVRIGIDWWSYLGGPSCLVELCVALIRACVTPGDDADPKGQRYTISDLAQIVATTSVRRDFNVSILQRSQLPWLFFLARHFCDELHDT